MAFPKGNKLGGRKKGSKNQETLAKEERRLIFDQRISEIWEDTIRKLPATYVADQFMGKAPDKVEHSGEIKTGEVIAPELLEIAKAELKKRLTQRSE